MPVLVDRGRRGLQVVTGQSCDSRLALLPPRDTDWIEIGVVNNMPDAALEATEQHFLTLLAAAARHRWVRVRFYSLAGVARGSRSAELLAAYGTTADLSRRDLDGLIVTGTEPLADDLRDEPYWPAFGALVNWASDHTISAVWSCLASHAAALHLDGIRRTRLPHKCFGVFTCAPVARHPLTAGLPSQFGVPHARYNGIRADHLPQSRYRILTMSPDAGADMFVREDKSLFVFLQGHPEYGVDTLLNEYRRDVGRYLRAERAAYPILPRGYFDAETTSRMAAFEHRARSRRDPAMLEQFPGAAAEQRLSQTWRGPAVQLYRNWLSCLLDGKGKRLASQPARRAAPASPVIQVARG